MTIKIVRLPDGVKVQQILGRPLKIVQGGYKIVQSKSGPAGDSALMDVGMGFEGFLANSIMRGVVLAHPLVTSAAASVAYTDTPPINMQQIVTLQVNGITVGTATFEIGANYATISFQAPSLLMIRGDFLSFSMPGVLDPNFSHFAFTYGQAA